MTKVVKVDKLFETVTGSSYNYFYPNRVMETDGPVDKFEGKKTAAFTSGKIFPLNHEESEESKYYQLLTFQINLMYYTGIVSYKPVRQDNKTFWTLVKTSTLQQVLSKILIWLPFSVFIITDIMIEINQFISGKKGNAKTYFECVTSVIYSLMYIPFLISIQRKRDLEGAVNQMYGGNIFSRRMRAQERKPFSNISIRIVLGYLVMVYVTRFANAVIQFGSLQYSSSVFLNSTKYFMKRIDQGRERFHLDTGPECSDPGFSINVCLGILEIWLRFTNHLMFMVLEILTFGTVPVTMWLAVKKFQGFIRTNRETSPVETVGLFRELAAFSRSINAVWSCVIFVRLAQMALRLAFSIGDQIGSGNVLKILNTLSSFFLRIVTLCLSGEAFRMMECFKEYLHEPDVWASFMNKSKGDEIQRMISQIDYGMIGIGSGGVYRLNYNFVAQMSTIVLTIFVVSFDK